MTTSMKDRIDEFLAQKRMAIIGVSHQHSAFSHKLFHELQKRGYDLVPVHPEMPEIHGVPSVARVQEIDPPVDTALIITPSEVTIHVVRDCAEAGVKRIWLYRGGTGGSVTPEAVNFCEEHGITVIPGYCPYMFIEKPGFVHRAHACLHKIMGKYPE